MQNSIKHRVPETPDAPSDPAFRRDVQWNLASFVFQATCGVLLNLFLGRVYGAEGVGVFNQCLAIVFIASQVGTFGLHYSVLRHVAERPADGAFIVACGLSALGLCSLSAGLFCTGLWFSIPLLGQYFQSGAMLGALALTVPAIWFFCLNKVLFGFLNGVRLMTEFAALQSVRYAYWFVGAGVLVYRGESVERIPALILFGEMALCMTTLLTILAQSRFRTLPKKSGSAEGTWAGRHLSFGSRSSLSGSLIEANARIDILVLGHFFADGIVGVYSMASLFFEGLSQIGAVLRNQWNPELTRLILSNQREDLQQTISRGYRLSAKLLWPACIAASLAYPIFVTVTGMAPEFLDASLPFAILCMGLAWVSGMQPFLFVLMQGNHPGRQTIFLGSCAALNLMLNVLLVPHLGMSGASIGTALSLVASAAYLQWEVRRLWGVRIDG